MFKIVLPNRRFWIGFIFMFLLLLSITCIVLFISDYRKGLISNKKTVEEQKSVFKDLVSSVEEVNRDDENRASADVVSVALKLVDDYRDKGNTLSKLDMNKYKNISNYNAGEVLSIDDLSHTISLLIFFSPDKTLIGKKKTVVINCDGEHLCYFLLGNPKRVPDCIDNSIRNSVEADYVNNINYCLEDGDILFVYTIDRALEDVVSDKKYMIYEQ